MTTRGFAAVVTSVFVLACGKDEPVQLVLCRSGGLMKTLAKVLVSDVEQ
jgi:hypothetical protein